MRGCASNSKFVHRCFEHAQMEEIKVHVKDFEWCQTSAQMFDETVLEPELDGAITVSEPQPDGKPKPKKKYDVKMSTVPLFAHERIPNNRLFRTFTVTRHGAVVDTENHAWLGEPLQHLAQQEYVETWGDV
ncbi:hypothetical protein DACRYDRAFT_120073 [Dacryopinax primogenitus]|uniref:Uncharacterized protein n=1 Tax=Dacryopinax primogenitus (strain DJM 731) TaxID=1858805 RepID=M5FTA1_DACPD|nr:uncharacterized protein DACRYDRAFT_120073 [Dacryopinax primogenitus]EJT96481.1 hypothetical protein DACRYDRAFT_120073 [Dacryopinax primogenitus]